MEPVWRRLRYELGASLTWRYRMGGLLERVDRFSDPVNGISRPAQVGPHWYQVSQISGMPIESRIWVDDPPSSSYPACLAVKAAERQGREHGERYLRRVREAVMLEARNVAHGDVLIALAEDLAEGTKGSAFDLDRFSRDLADPETLLAFEEDLKETRFRDVGRFPTLVLRSPTGHGSIVVGYRPYDLLREAIAHVAPDLAPERVATDPVAYALAWPTITVREVAEVVGGDVSSVAAALDRAVEEGLLQARGGGRFARAGD